MIRKASLLVVLFLQLIGQSYAQLSKDSVVMVINDYQVTRSEFQNMYRKNSNTEHLESDKSLEEYLQLYINFKLKVQEALDLGMDTLKSFKQEFAKYRNQSAKQYLTDNTVNEKTIKEAYERMKHDVCASHILIKCAISSLPKDTLKAYNRVMALRSRIINGEDFNTIASIPNLSDDSIAQKNGGRLGCFAALQMVYPFETAVYNLPIGEVSMPVRTSFGYHLVKVSERKQAQGEILVAHIVLQTKPNMSGVDSARQTRRIKEIYNRLKKGESFESLAKDYSDDRKTAQNGGKLPWIAINKSHPSFEKEVFKIKSPGDISKPFRTPFGYHIVKLLDRKELKAYDEIKPELTQRLERLGRFNSGKTALVNKLKIEYGFEEHKKAKQAIFDLADSSLFQNLISQSTLTKYSKPIFTLAGKDYFQKDFIEFTAKYRPATNQSVDRLMESLYNSYIEKMVIAYEDSQLENKYPEFKALVQEYYDGMLLFELTNKKVWSKAVNDSIGIKEFYNANAKKYMWGERVDANLYVCKNQTVADLVRNMILKGKSKEEIITVVNKNDPLNVQIDNKIFDNADKLKVGLSGDIPSKESKQIVLIDVLKVLPPAVKPLKDCKGNVVADYQKLLEKEWLKELRKKYKVDINKEVLSTIK